MYMCMIQNDLSKQAKVRKELHPWSIFPFTMFFPFRRIRARVHHSQFRRGSSSNHQNLSEFGEMCKVCLSSVLELTLFHSVDRAHKRNFIEEGYDLMKKDQILLLIHLMMIKFLKTRMRIRWFLNFFQSN